MAQENQVNQVTPEATDGIQATQSAAQPIAETVPVTDVPPAPVEAAAPVAEESKKVSEEELKEIQELNKVMQQITLAIGQTFLASYRAMKDFDKEQDKLNKLSEVLEEKYGKVNININDGTVSPLQDNQQPAE